MRLLITRPLPDLVIKTALRHFDVTLRDRASPMTQAEAAQAVADYDAILCTIGDAFNGTAFDGPVKTRILANFGVGYDHIDVTKARSRDVQVTNTPDAVTEATADIALTLLLMTARRASEGERLLRRNEWMGWTPTQLLGTHVTGKRLGIVGMGRIGQAIANRAHHGFRMEIGFFNRSDKTTDMPATRYAALHDLLSWSDFTVIAVPGGAGTRHLIDESALNALGPDGHLINIARGDIVDEAALTQALQQGKIKGAGLDVYENEPTVPAALRALENVTLLPHLGTATLEVRENMGQMALSNVIALAQGKDLLTPV